jgi:hypothetical protein
MLDNIRFSNPDTMQKPPGYSHVVEVTDPAARSISPASSASTSPARWAPMPREQMEIAFENVKAALASVGASFGQCRQAQQLYCRHRHEHRALP